VSFKAFGTGSNDSKENLSNLSTAVLHLRLQALNLPISGSCTQLIGALKRAATLASRRPAKQTQTSKHFRGHLVPATTTRAKEKDRAAPDDSLVEGEDIDSANSDQDDEDPTPAEQLVYTVEDLLRAPEPVQTSSSPFLDNQLRVIQNTQKSSLSQALLNGQIRFRTSALPSTSLIRNSIPYGLTWPVGKELGGKNL